MVMAQKPISLRLFHGVKQHFTNASFYSPQSFMGAKNCKSGELIRQNVTEQHYFARTEA